MTLVLSLVIAAAIPVFLRTPLKKVPSLFYLLACVIAIAGACLTLQPPASGFLRGVAYMVQKGQLAFALFAVVMYAGALPDSFRIRQKTMPVRGELSLVACALETGHVVVYGMSFAPRAFALDALRGSVAASLVLALVLVALLVVLGVTSFQVVKRAMAAKKWKSVQRLAYPFFFLAYAHLVLMLAPAAFQGSQQAAFNIALYSAVVLVYAVLRVRRARAK